MIVVGFGARAGVGARELSAAVRSVLAACGIPPDRVGVLASLDRRVAESAAQELAASAGWRLLGFPAAALAAVPVPNPSAAAEAATGTAGVAEAAALLAAGAGGVLLAPKRICGRTTVALAESSTGRATYFVTGHS
ncbi:cobalamin biosynthesis protein [Actinoplanes missouriensis]|uniref:cobalamin biosynthesis protein n=1 Tax=Actinoplanes missouriensis TaxID=1866 RepID=UPI00340D5319